MSGIAVVIVIGLALLVAFAARRAGFSFWAYLVLSLLPPCIITGWATLRVAKWINNRPAAG